MKRAIWLIDQYRHERRCKHYVIRVVRHDAVKIVTIPRFYPPTKTFSLLDHDTVLDPVAHKSYRSGALSFLRDIRAPRASSRSASRQLVEGSSRGGVSTMEDSYGP